MMNRIILCFCILVPFLSFAKRPDYSKPQKTNLSVSVMKGPKPGDPSTLIGTGLGDADILVIVDSDTLMQKSLFDYENIFKDIPVGKEILVKVSKKGYVPQEKKVKPVLYDGPYGDIFSVSFLLKKEN